MRPLAILRPEPGGSLSAARAEAMGFETILRRPLFKVRPCEWTPPDPERFDAILMTSANAARHAGEGLDALKTLPVHAVGDATAAAARAAGLMVDRVGEGNVADLLARLPSELRLLHLTGRTRRIPADPAQTIVPVIVYASVPRERADVVDLAGCVACVHSPAAGERLGQLVDRAGIDRSTVQIAAISEAAADACGEGWARLANAATPDDPTLLSLAKRLCDTGERGGE